MRPVLACTFLLLAAGCPPKRTDGPAPVAAGAGCPAAAGVYIASYLAPEDGAQAGQGHTGWVLPLHDQVVESLEGVPDYATIDAAAATAAGVPAPPPTAWVLIPGGAPCKATIGNYYAAAIDSPTKNIAYGVELTGCAAPPDASDASAIVLASEAAPTRCQVVPPRPVAERLGETDKQGTWARPTKETPIPAPFAAVLPQRTCVAPTCEMLWSIAQVEVAGKPVAWAGAVNWLELPADAKPEAQCTWPVETFSGFFVAGADGGLVKVTEAQDHPLVLTAVLADDGGPKVLVAAGPGEYTTYDLAGGTPVVGRHLVWLVPHPDAFTGLDRLGPHCES